jgi:hypothetical protein
MKICLKSAATIRQLLEVILKYKKAQKEEIE